MSLDKTVLKSNIINILNNMAAMNESTTEVNVVDAFATQLSEVIDAYVKTAKINYTSGLAAGATAVTGIFNGSLS